MLWQVESVYKLALAFYDTLGPNLLHSLKALSMVVRNSSAFLFAFDTISRILLKTKFTGFDPELKIQVSLC